ncbi:MAG: serine hydrolase, partial [Polyangiales bacterium]
NSAASYVLSAIVQKATGQRMGDFLQARVFDPLGIKRPRWRVSGEGVTLGGYGLSLRTEDLAKLGELYLRKGSWWGRQLLAAEWVASATKRQIATGGDPDGEGANGYGYQFWRARHGYQASGRLGQLCLVLPEQDVVVVFTAASQDPQAALQQIWEVLLPALRSAALPSDAVAARDLKHALAMLQLPPLAGALSPRIAPQVSGKRFVFSDDGVESDLVLEWRSPKQPARLVMLSGRAQQSITCRSGAWTKARTVLPGDTEPRHVAASCAWVSDDTFSIQIVLYELGSTLDMTLKYEADQLHVTEVYDFVRRPARVGVAR